jgi:putative ABC transport system ATP-binding protein
MSIIKLLNVTKEYTTKSKTIQALKNISISISSNNFVALTGSSGSGKSTLLQLIGGFEPPTSGQIFINNKNISSLPDKQLSDLRRAQIGFVFQNFYLQPTLTVRQNIELSAIFSSISKPTRRDKTEKLAASVGLSDKLDSLPHELSGGQTQRVAFLRAIYDNPKIILADEPTSNLDKNNSKTILELLRGFQTKNRATIVVATHNDLPLAYADQIIHLENGAVK